MYLSIYQRFNHPRIDIRRQLIAEENNRDKSEPPVTCSNGETMRQILARSKHTLMMSQNKWTDIQRHRVNILFKYYINVAVRSLQLFTSPRYIQMDMTH
ncbi:hypothetical protein NF347_08275 [Paramuribaculum intestinale]|uniref:hypothetical protein n=1 Tax=Paramuribaculum intestinale TaxID=2094151 RepID=UPI00105723E3|nr:hypothetical protein [Paramuribaculum intestinale]WLT40987.1 hypothetical protein NF347_08275 [Paramuribaculum intestinale]